MDLGCDATDDVHDMVPTHQTSTQQDTQICLWYLVEGSGFRVYASAFIIGLREVS